MLFNSIDFFVFIFIFFVLYFTTKENVRLGVCLLGSYVFYAWWDWRFLGLIITSTLLNFYFGLLLNKTQVKDHKKILVIACGINLLFLGFFKYFNFFVDSINSSLVLFGHNLNYSSLDIILPVGISFYTFQSMSYVIDVYRRELDVEKSLLRFSTFIAFFPQLVAGPIVRANQLLPQLKNDQQVNWPQIVNGINLILYGYLMKVVVADSLAYSADQRFLNPETHTSLSLMIGVLFYTFQIYGDFCGYSSIAIGIGKILGFDLGMNFDRPYFSKNFSGFWTRWHISLSSWLRDYLYIPLGGNRKGSKRTMINLMTTMLLGGLWHGAGWNFVFWGFLHGTYLISQRLIGMIYFKLIAKLPMQKFFKEYLLILVVFLLTMFSWIFFRASTINEAFFIIDRIFKFNGLNILSVPGLFLVIKGLFIIIFLIIIEALSFKLNYVSISQKYPMANVLFAAFSLALLAFLGTYGMNSFIYFQF